MVRTIMSRRRYRSTHVTRERILDAATELFAQKGYAGTGVDQLATRSGIAKTAIAIAGIRCGTPGGWLAVEGRDRFDGARRGAREN